jgi:hypothetical protein
MPKPFNFGEAPFLNCRQATFHRIPTLIPTVGRPEIIRSPVAALSFIDECSINHSS